MRIVRLIPFWYLSHVIKLRKTVDSETWYKSNHLTLLTFVEGHCIFLCFANLKSEAIWHICSIFAEYSGHEYFLKIAFNMRLYSIVKIAHLFLKICLNPTQYGKLHICIFAAEFLKICFKPEAIRQVPSSPSFCNDGSSRLNSYLFTCTKYMSTNYLYQKTNNFFLALSSLIRLACVQYQCNTDGFRKCIMDIWFIPRMVQPQQEVHRKREPPEFEVPVSRICISFNMDCLN